MHRCMHACTPASRRARAHTHTHKHAHTHGYMQAEKATKETIAFMIKYTSAQFQTSQLYSGLI
jgi:hypothetical protein